MTEVLYDSKTETVIYWIRDMPVTEATMEHEEQQMLEVVNSPETDVAIDLRRLLIEI